MVIIISFFCGLFLGKELQKLKNSNKNLLKEISKFISYSQCFEDLILFCVFYDVKNGFYIDIGANDPNWISVTKAFYLRGWYGINIEPLSKKYQELIKYRQRDINIQIGVGKNPGKAKFFGNDAGATLVKEHSKNNTNTSNINIDTMKNICNKYIPKNKIIQFCKIDIEGGEKDALLGYDLGNYRPKVFCIESTKPNSHIPCFSQWENILFKNDYSFAFQYEINRYYIDNRINGLRERFFFAEKAIQIYKQNNNKTINNKKENFKLNE